MATKGEMSSSAINYVWKTLTPKLIKMNFSSIVFLLDIILWLLNIQSLRYLITGEDLNILLDLAPKIMIKIYGLLALAIATIVWIILRICSKSKHATKVKEETPGLFREYKGLGIIFKNYNKAYLFFYRDLWSILIFLMIISDNLNKLGVDSNIRTANLIILVINAVNLSRNLWKYTQETRVNPYPDRLEEISEIDEDDTEVFKTLAQRKVDRKEFRILKNTFYHNKYLGKPNLVENKYFVVSIENNSVLKVINSSNNWDEIRYNYEQLISMKKDEKEKATEKE